MGISEGQQGGASPGSPLFLSPEENPSGSVRFPSWFTLAFFFLWKSVAASILHLGRLYWFHERSFEQVREPLPAPLDDGVLAHAEEQQQQNHGRGQHQEDAEGLRRGPWGEVAWNRATDHVLLLRPIHEHGLSTQRALRPGPADAASLPIEGSAAAVFTALEKTTAV